MAVKSCAHLVTLLFCLDKLSAKIFADTLQLLGVVRPGKTSTSLVAIFHHSSGATHGVFRLMVSVWGRVGVWQVKANAMVANPIQAPVLLLNHDAFDFRLLTLITPRRHQCWIPRGWSIRQRDLLTHCNHRLLFFLRFIVLSILAIDEASEASNLRPVALSHNDMHVWSTD